MKLLITGGAGFIGSNAARYFSNKGDEVHILDNLSRKGSDINLKWLRNFDRIVFHKVCVTDYDEIYKIINDNSFDVVLHLAGQVAVTASVRDPRKDFEDNALGTFNICEAIRNSATKPILIFSSTNKVYGKCSSVEFEESESRYQFARIKGIDESTQLEFYSPYGCSKGAADQYVIDYARVYGIRSVVLRQSCIYGPRQMGVEDQGWVAWFLIAAETGKEITIFGTGKQVRDVLYVDDLVKLYEAIIRRIEECKGVVFNVGGGPNNTISLNELIKKIKGDHEDLKVKYGEERPGDQEIYISDISKVKKYTGWVPSTSVEEGLEKLSVWIKENRELFDE